MTLENFDNSTRNKRIFALLNLYKVDILFTIFCGALILDYSYWISIIKVPPHDGAYYLLNAHDWLANKPLDEPFRPPLISWIIAGIWSITGENWIIVKGLQAAFTISAGIILYILLRKYKGRLFALGVAALTLTNGTLFFFSTQILTEGLALFFLVLTLYFLKSRKENYWLLAGVTIGLTFASRYPIAVQALAIFIMELIVSRKPKLAIRTISGALPIIIIVVLAVYLKAGEFHMALAKDTSISLFLSPYYLLNSIKIWGFTFLLVPIALLYKRTYADSFNYTFLAWFIVALIFWSASTANFQYRFTIQYTPAVSFLSILAVENILKSGIATSSIVSIPSTARSCWKFLKNKWKYIVSIPSTARSCWRFLKNKWKYGWLNK
jgi:4-amino-4-deoxy-L-arabinose transferase-like glycosyltransferase